MPITTEQRLIKARTIEQLRIDAVEAVGHKDLRGILECLSRMKDHVDIRRDGNHIRYLGRVSDLIARHGLSDVPRWHDLELQELISMGAFIDHHGGFLFIGPHGPRRSGQPYLPELTAVCGECQAMSFGVAGCTRLRLEGLITDGALAFVPFVPSRVVGVLAHSMNEYFVPGDMWRIGAPDGPVVPSLLNVEAVRLAAETTAKHVICSIFDTVSAQALTSWLNDPVRARRLIAAEYLKHEHGHAAGIGMKQRRQLGLFRGHRAERLTGYALDESRADGTESDFYKQYISGSDEERDIHAVTIIVRMLDLSRLSTLTDESELPLDVDVLTTLKWWEQLVVGGTLFLHRNGRLGLAPQLGWRNGSIDVDPEHSEVDMTHIVWPMRMWATQVEAEEWKCGPPELRNLVLKNHVGDRIRELFQNKLFIPCQKLAKGIRP